MTMKPYRKKDQNPINHNAKYFSTILEVFINHNQSMEL
jgi:hypothetical protein